MSQTVLQAGSLVFWLHTYDVVNDERPSVNVGKNAPDARRDAKLWLEPEIEIDLPGSTLSVSDLRRAIKATQKNRQALIEAWKASRCES